MTYTNPFSEFEKEDWLLLSHGDLRASRLHLQKKSPYIQTPHRVSGLMLANHTSMASVFKRITEQYAQLRKRNAFMEQYKKYPMFEDGLEEFDDARNVLQDLIDEYSAAENPDYLDPPTT